MHNSAKSGLFLIEMIIAICFFALSAAVCTSLFVRAYLISKETRQANMAVLTAQSVVESFKAADGTAEGTANAFDTVTNAGDGSSGFLLFYDKNWQQTQGGKNAYTVDVAINENASPRDIVVNVNTTAEDGTQTLLYHLEAKTYIPAGKG
jgi:Tfp pilus assembly protein PilV